MHGWTILPSPDRMPIARRTRLTCSTAWPSRVPLWRPPSMPAHNSFDYAIVRVVPHVEREEFLNAGVILFCRTQDYLGARIELDKPRLAALAPDLDVAEVEQHLTTISLICADEPEAGPIGRLTRAERFHWLVSPGSTVIQPSPVHSGLLCADPDETLEHLMNRMVRPP